MFIELLTALAIGQPARPSPIPQHLERIEQQLAATWRKGDCSAWGAMLAPGWSVIHINGAVITRDEALRMCNAPRPPIDVLIVDDLSARSFGDAAVVTGRTTMTTGGSAPATIVLRFTDVFIRRAGRWQVVASHATRIDPDPQRTGAARVPDQPDFSGRWVLEGPQPAAPETPRTLTVRQSLVRTNVRGEPMEPFFRDLTVERQFESATHSETYWIGTSGGSVGGSVTGSGGGSRTGPSTHISVKWEGRSLVIESGSYTGSTPESGVWTQRREVWALDPDGCLRVTISTRSSSDLPKTDRLTYRRQ
jgi:hypothetical protein